MTVIEKIYIECKKAIAEENTEELIEYLNKTADVVMDSLVRLALENATYESHDQFEKLMNLFIKGGYKDNPLIPAIKGDDHNGVLALLKMGIDVNQPNFLCETPIFASSIKSVDIVRALLEAGANVNDQGRFGYTPLMFAVKRGRIDNINAFLEYDADITIKNASNNTAIDLAREFGDKQYIVAMLESHLLEKEIDQDIVDIALGM